jgi:thymidylate synthase
MCTSACLHFSLLQMGFVNYTSSFSLQVLNINPTKMDINGFCFEDFELLHYEPHKKIAMKMAV